MRILVAALLWFCACYKPQSSDCAFRCSSAGTCPTGSSCENGFCRTPGFSGACGDATMDSRSVDTAPATMKRIFVSSSISDGNLGGLDAADTRCQTLADAVPSLGGSYKAWLSSDLMDAGIRLATYPLPYVLVDGTPVAMDFNHLTNFPLLHEINLTEQNQAPVLTQGTCPSTFTQSVWTGTMASGARASNNCGNWFVGSSGTSGLVGRFDRTTVEWSENCSAGCDRARHVYCLEQ